MNWKSWEAVWKDDFETAKGWLDKGASVNTQDRLGLTVLMIACLNHNKAMVDLLLKRGAEVNRTAAVS
jgi:ankyrin repeat protein